MSRLVWYSALDATIVCFCAWFIADGAGGAGAVGWLVLAVGSGVNLGWRWSERVTRDNERWIADLLKPLRTEYELRREDASKAGKP